MSRLDADRQRIDRWLWHSRIVRTRTLAATLADDGRVRVNGQRITAPSRSVRIGDVLTVSLPSGIKILRVVSFSERRGSADDARQLYDDLSPPAFREIRPPTVAEREAGSGRPTKHERRALDRLRQRGSGPSG